MIIKEDEGCLICPKCGTDQIHIGWAQAEQEKFSVRSTGNRSNTNPSAKHNRPGSVVRVRFWCDNEHWFEYSFSYADDGCVDIDRISGDLEQREREPPEMWTRR